MEQKTKRTIAKEILIAVGICIGGAVASIINSMVIHSADEELTWFVGFIIFCYIIRLIAWAIKVLSIGKS